MDRPGLVRPLRPPASPEQEVKCWRFALTAKLYGTGFEGNGLLYKRHVAIDPVKTSMYHGSMITRKALTAAFAVLALSTTACTVSASETTPREERREARQAEKNRETAREYLDRANETAGKVTDFLRERANEVVEEFELEGVLAPPTDGPYDRDAFGTSWYDVDQNGCDTRNDVLARDLTDLVIDEDDCTVLFGTLHDPYTGETYEYERGHSVVDIDHVVPLAAAWSMGADSWTDAQRLAFANDPANLEASYMGANRSKGDRTLSEWMPINEEFHCAYATAFVKVAKSYNLFLSPADSAVARRAC